MTGILAMVGSLIIPVNDTPSPADIEKMSRDGPRVLEWITAAMEGFTGGAMLAMVSTAMLPEAFHGTGNLSGSIFVLGFMVSCAFQAVGIHIGHPAEYFGMGLES